VGAVLSVGKISLRLVRAKVSGERMWVPGGRGWRCLVGACGATGKVGKSGSMLGVEGVGSSAWMTVANMVVAMGVVVCLLLYSWSTYIDLECEGVFLRCVALRT